MVKVDNAQEVISKADGTWTMEHNRKSSTQRVGWLSKEITVRQGVLASPV